MYFRAFILLSVVALSYADTLAGTIDVKRLQSILQEGVMAKGKDGVDPSTLYHSVQGLKIINAKIPDICQTFKSLKNDHTNVEAAFYVSNAAFLSGCQNYLSPDIMKAATLTLDKKDSTIQELYYAVYTLKALGRGDTMDKDSALKNLVQLLKKDDSPMNYGYVFGLCEHIGCTEWTVSHAEGLLQAADESDKRMLHFEGGLPATSLVLTTMLSSFKTAKKPSPLSFEQRSKFASYLLSRRAVSTPRGAAMLLNAALAIADDQPTPVAVAIKGKKQVTSESENIEIAVTDLLGRPIKTLQADDVIAQSGTRLADDVVILSKQPLTPKNGEPGTFLLNLNKIKSQYGNYKIALSAGGQTTSVTLAVLEEMEVKAVEIGIGDVDGTTSPKTTTVAYPNKLTEKLQADHLQKVSIKFTALDKSKKPMVVQQAFLRVGTATDEAIFAAEPDNTKTYKVDLNVASLGKLLNYESGAHSLTLYLGDNSVNSPIQWQLGTVAFSFGNAIGAPRQPTPTHGPLPEISHSFREPEPRPPRLVSDVFAAACAAPLLLLLVLWGRLGVNFKNMPLAISPLVFHVALGACLALYGYFWLRLSMFETVRYLLPLGAITFLAGHRVLRRLANKN